MERDCLASDVPDRQAWVAGKLTEISFTRSFTDTDLLSPSPSWTFSSLSLSCSIELADAQIRLRLCAIDSSTRRPAAAALPHPQLTDSPAAAPVDAASSVLGPCACKDATEVVPCEHMGGGQAARGPV